MFDVTLTFDNGPEPSVTPRVLNVLARRGVRTTFFVIGNKLLTRDVRACTERAHAEGHWIGNHTWTHTRPLGERPARRRPIWRSGAHRPRSPIAEALDTQYCASRQSNSFERRQPHVPIAGTRGRSAVDDQIARPFRFRGKRGRSCRRPAS